MEQLSEIEITKKLQAIELEILKEFISVCEEMDLNYYIIGGTLLGAVRHKGFIPWDDDIDVGMPRKDYEKFLQCAQDRLSNVLFLQTYYSDKSYFRNYAKIRNNNTTFVEESVKHLKMNHGIYIDVFPIDYYPNKRYERAILEVKKMFYTARTSQEYYIKNENKFRRFVRCFLAKFSRSADEAVKKRDLVIKGSKETKFIINHDGNWGKKEIMPAEWFAKSMKLTFEGIEVNAPVEFDKILTHLYGNYMVYPPKDKQVSHHETVLIDVEKSYKYYTDSLVVK